MIFYLTKNQVTTLNAMLSRTDEPERDAAAIAHTACMKTSTARGCLKALRKMTPALVSRSTRFEGEKVVLLFHTTLAARSIHEVWTQQIELATTLMSSSDAAQTDSDSDGEADDDEGGRAEG